MKFSNRLFLYGPFALVVAAAAAVMAYWWFAAQAVTAYLDATNGHAVAPGIVLKFSSRHMQGFPFRVDAILDDVEMTVAASQGPVVWKSEHFAMHALTYGPSQAIYEAAGRQTLSWTGLDGQHHVWAFVPAALRASSYTQSNALARFDLDAIAIRSPELNADRVQLHLRHNPTHDGFDIIATGQGIHLSQALQSGFGDTIKTLSLDAALAPAAPLNAMMGGHADWRTALEAWRARGGSVTLNSLAMEWTAMKAQASGKLSLDAQHRPDGMLAVNLVGVQSLAGELARLGLPQGEDNGLAPALLIMAQATNAQIDLSADLGFKNGTLSVGDAAAGVLRPLY